MRGHQGPGEIPRGSSSSFLSFCLPLFPLPAPPLAYRTRRKCVVTREFSPFFLCDARSLCFTVSSSFSSSFLVFSTDFSTLYGASRCFHIVIAVVSEARNKLRVVIASRRYVGWALSSFCLPSLIILFLYFPFYSFSITAAERSVLLVVSGTN